MRAELSFFGRFRVEAVREFARLLRVPIEIYEHDMHEAKVSDVWAYIRECELIAEKVFDLSEPEIDEFSEWAREHLFEMFDNPFVLHEHPFYFVAAYEGFFDHSDPLMKEFEEKWVAADIKLRWPNGELNTPK